MRPSVRSISRLSKYHSYFADFPPRPTFAPWVGCHFCPVCTNNPPSAANKALHPCCLLLLPLNQVCIYQAHYQSAPVLTFKARNRFTHCPTFPAWAIA